jgi:hypothetical protein
LPEHGDIVKTSEIFMTSEDVPSSLLEESYEPPINASRIKKSKGAEKERGRKNGERIFGEKERANQNPHQMGAELTTRSWDKEEG